MLVAGALQFCYRRCKLQPRVLRRSRPVTDLLCFLSILTNMQLRYSPPKASIWGHSLRKMKPDVARSRFNSFLETNVEAHTWSSHGIAVFSATSIPVEEKVARVLQRFEYLTGAKAPRDGTLWYITQADFERCIAELIYNPHLCSDKELYVSVDATVEVKTWRKGGKCVPTKSLMTLDYGTSPRISSMFLNFESLELYEHIKQGFIDADLCRLNDKYLKGR